MNRRLGLVSAALALVVAAGGGTALAADAGPVDSAGVVHGCFTDGEFHGSHTLWMQDAGTGCPKDSTAVSWNEQGPAGPAGTVGPAGTPGPAGSNGHGVLSGTGAPGSSVGSDGDFYIDTAASVLYGPKAGGAWPGTGVSLIGPAGPAGAAGGTSSLDDLNGVPCENGTGNTAVGYDSSGNVAIQCVTPPDGSPPGDSQANPVDLGTKLDGRALTCSQLPITQTGAATGTGYTWYAFSVDPMIIGTCEIHVTVSPAADPAKGTPGAVFNVYFSGSSTAIDTNRTAFTIFSNELTPTAAVIYIAVRSQPATQSVSYTLTWTAIACPCTSGPIGFS